MNGYQMHSPQSAAAQTGAKMSNTAAGATAELNTLLADMFVLYIKTKNFHWHVTGPHFRDYHLLFDQQADQVLAATDAIAERVRKIGGTTLRSVRHVGLIQRLDDNDADAVGPQEMLATLRDDNRALCSYMRETHTLCNDLEDVATASLLENWIDEAEQRIWFLTEASHHG